MWKRFLFSAVVLGVPAVSSVAIAGHPHNSVAVEPHLVNISDLVVPIIDSGRMDGRLSYDIVIDAVDAVDAARLTAEVARLRSTAIASGLEFSRLYVSGLRPVDAEVLAAELTRTLQAESPGIERVLVVKVAASLG